MLDIIKVYFVIANRDTNRDFRRVSGADDPQLLEAGQANAAETLLNRAFQAPFLDAFGTASANHDLFDEQI